MIDRSGYLGLQLLYCTLVRALKGDVQKKGREGGGRGREGKGVGVGGREGRRGEGEGGQRGEVKRKGRRERQGHNGTIRLRRHCIPGLCFGEWVLWEHVHFGVSQINLISFQNKLKLEI